MSLAHVTSFLLRVFYSDGTALIGKGAQSEQPVSFDYSILSEISVMFAHTVYFYSGKSNLHGTFSFHIKTGNVMANKKAKATKAEVKKLNETGIRKGADRRAKNEVVEAKHPERRKAKRRRQIDPTTCEREYDDAEIEFMHALDEYKRASGRMFPTCSEILEVIKGLGYRQVAERTEGFSMEQDTDSTSQDFDTGEFDEESLESEIESQVI